MITEIFMPKMSTSMEEGQLSKLYKKIGDPVAKGELFMEIFTDKVNMEVEAVGSGVLRMMFINEGDAVPVGTTIGIIADADEMIPEKFIKDFANNDENKESIQYLEKRSEIKIEEDLHKSKSNEMIKISPRAKKIAKDKGIDIMQVTPKDGVITEAEVLSYLDAQNVKTSPLAGKIAKDKGIDLSEIAGTGIGGKVMKSDVDNFILKTNEDSQEQEYETVPFAGIRKIVADRLSQSKSIAPHIYFSVEVDMKNCISFRKKANEKLSKEGIKISFTDIIVASSTKSLKKYKEVNAGIFGNEIRIFKNTNIGVAVDTEKGLLVPVIKNTNKMTLTEIAKGSKDLIDKARIGKINPDELKGGTFTISNLGLLNIDFFTAIINPPESAILAVSSVKDKPVVKDGKIIIRPVMQIVLSIDHRIIDGALATKFLNQIKEYLEEPVFLSL